jgi:hypothetical protein
MPDTIRLTCPKCSAAWDAAERPGSIATCPGCGSPVKVALPTVIPTGPKDRCPACGANNSVPLGDKALEAFYGEYKQARPLLLYRPRKCKECGQRWEVNPPRSALLAGIAVLGVGLVLCLVVIGLCAWWAVDSDEPARLVGYAIFALGGAAVCGYGIRHYLHKLRVAPS